MNARIKKKIENRFGCRSYHEYYKELVRYDMNYGSLMNIRQQYPINSYPWYIDKKTYQFIVDCKNGTFIHISTYGIKEISDGRLRLQIKYFPDSGSIDNMVPLTEKEYQKLFVDQHYN